VGPGPHASTHVPGAERARWLLDDDALAAELLRLTDAHTDGLYDWIRDLGGSLFVNRVSRLVVDPERFADDAAEPMAAVGQGAVYLRTSAGQPLRDADPAERSRLLERYYAPYHRALEGVVAGALDQFGTCLVLDCHSFSSVPLPSEPDQDPDRPDICLGTDPFHTPARLVDALATGFRAAGLRVEVDRPFSGALVPGPWYATDRRVTAVMLEVRRDRYLDETTGTQLPGFAELTGRIRAAVTAALER
jgi:N-formylglutamate amidohydrolase